MEDTAQSPGNKLTNGGTAERGRGFRALAHLSGRRFVSSLALRLLAYYLLLVIPILAAAFYFDSQANRRLREDVAAADLSLAQAIALETDALLLKAQQAVAEFAGMPAVVDADLAGMEQAFAIASAARQDINLFYRLDADGACKTHLQRLDEWIRRKLRCVRLKQCKREKTIADFLPSLGVPEWRSWILALSA